MSEKKNIVPLALLATRVSFLEDNVACVVGFWYWNPPHVPIFQSDMKRFHSDVNSGISVLTHVIGQSEQIRDLFAYTVAMTSPDDPYPFREKAMSVENMQEGDDVSWIDWDNPQPDFVPIDCWVTVSNDKEVLRKELLGREKKIVLMIDLDWRCDPFEDFPIDKE